MSSPLPSHAGPIALAAGLVFAAEDVWRLLAPFLRPGPLCRGSSQSSALHSAPVWAMKAATAASVVG